MGQIKIAIIGAGSSQFSGGIIRDICVTPNLHGIKITLMDIDEKRLRFIGAMGKNWRMNFMLVLILSSPQIGKKPLMEHLSL